MGSERVTKQVVYSVLAAALIAGGSTAAQPSKAAKAGSAETAQKAKSRVDRP